MTQAWIYQPAKSAMSSGTAKAHDWVLEFVATKPRRKDSDTGWIRSDETQTQIRLEFSTLEEAQNYAATNGIGTQVVLPHHRAQKLKTYADNFRHDRPEPWTH